jgi:hypothetical protein
VSHRPDPHRQCLALGLALLVAITVNILAGVVSAHRLDAFDDRLTRLERSLGR